jgi:hypothetical protein
MAQGLTPERRVMITDEKRAFKRTRRKFAVKYKRHGVPSDGRGTSVSENISLGGVYFISLEEFKIGQLVDCMIRMPGVSGEGKWEARVVRCDKSKDRIVDTFGIAVEFVKSFGDSEKKLKKILEI